MYQQHTENKQPSTYLNLTANTALIRPSASALSESSWEDMDMKFTCKGAICAKLLYVRKGSKVQPQTHWYACRFLKRTCLRFRARQPEVVVQAMASSIKAHHKQELKPKRPQQEHDSSHAAPGGDSCPLAVAQRSESPAHSSKYKRRRPVGCLESYCRFKCG